MTELDPVIEAECVRAEEEALAMSASFALVTGDEDAARLQAEAESVVRRIARGRVLWRHGLGPWIDAEGRVNDEAAPRRRSAVRGPHGGVSGEQHAP